MAIHVTTDYYWIKPPKELEEKVRDLVYIAALAKKLKLDNVYEQAKNSFLKIYNKWEIEGPALAKKKTSTNWLGAGTVYVAESMLTWDFQIKLGDAIVDDIPIDDCAKELKKELSKI